MEDLDDVVMYDNEEANEVLRFLFENEHDYYLAEDIRLNIYLESSAVKKAISCLLNCNLIRVRYNEDTAEKEYSAQKHIDLNDWIYAIDQGIDIELLEQYICLKDNKDLITNINNGDYEAFKKEKEEKKKNSHKEFLKNKAMRQYSVREIKRLYEVNESALNALKNKKDKTINDIMMLTMFTNHSKGLKIALHSIVEKYVSNEDREYEYEEK